MQSHKTQFLKSTLTLVLLIVTASLFTGCEKEDTSGDPGTGGGGSTTGQGMFWVASDLGCGSITVTCAGISKTITGFYSSSTPACGATGGANFDLPGGTYSYTASCSGKTWSGNINITNGSCSRIQLTSSGGSGGGEVEAPVRRSLCQEPGSGFQGVHPDAPVKE